MMDNAAPEIGHNRPPPYDADALEKLRAGIIEQSQAVSALLERGEIESEEGAKEARDMLAAVKATAKEVETQRKAAKEPHLEAGRAVDAAYKSITEPLDRMAKKLADVLGAWMRIKREEQERAIQAERERLERERRAAEEAARAAEQRNDEFGAVEAERRAAEAKKAEAKIAKARATGAVESASGGARAATLRRTKHARVVNIRLALSALLKDEGAEIEISDLVSKLAMARLRATGEVLPGVEIYETEAVV